MKLPCWLAPGCFAVAFAAALLRSWPPAMPAFVAPPPVAPSREAPRFAARFLPNPVAAAHAATLAQLPDGRIAAAWFAGSREGAGDVAIWFATWDENAWSPPRPIVSRETVAADTRAAVRKLGNPVLHAEGDRLHLWVVSAGVGGWAGSSINHSVSRDGGVSWSKLEKLVTSPLFNISTLVRSPPLPLADGGLGLPVYHEFIGKHGEWLRLNAAGRLMDKVRMPADGPQLQPAAVALDRQRTVAFLRDAGPGPGRVRVAASDSAGDHWEAAAPLPLGNPNSSIAALRLASGRLLLAGNDEAGRHRLHLWLSDDGRSWRLARTVDAASDDRAEFSYPALLQARDGSVHLAWTWQRQRIKHAAFNEAWLEGGR